MRQISLFFILSLCFAGVFAQKSGPVAGDIPPQISAISKWRFSVDKNPPYAVGDIITLRAKGTVTDTKWHLYSSIPTTEMTYNPTDIVLEKDASGVAPAGKTSESVKPIEEDDEIMGGIVRYHSAHEVTWSRKFRITGENPQINGELTGQICQTDGQCILLMVPFSFTPAVSAKPAAAQVEETPAPGALEPGDSLQNDSLTADSASADTAPVLQQTPPPAEVVASNPLEDESVWSLFWKAFVFGLGTLLTPCVFPMIPITVSYFTKQSRNKAHGIMKGTAYGVSIFLIYSVVGLLISALFGGDALYTFSTHWLTNVAFFVIFIVFALSFMGMFELTLPGSISTAVDKQSDRRGYLGIFFMALTLAIVSFSCTGPIVGTLLVDSASSGKGIWAPFAGMAGFGVALGLPFALFAIFPGWLSGLPKSGGWLNVVKVVFGFLELALAMKFLSNADLANRWHMLDREVFIAIWIAIFMGLGIYLFGFIRLPHDSPVEKLSVPRVVLAMLSIAFVFYLLPGLWGSNLPVLEGVIPPHNTNVGVRILGGNHGGGGGPGTADFSVNSQVCSQTGRKYYEVFKEKEAHGYCMFYDYDEALAFAKKVNKPLFLDFTGHTCANCRKMETQVWPQPEVAGLLRNEFVMVSLYVDDKTPLAAPETIAGEEVETIGKKNLVLQQTLYGTIAQPLYALQGTDGKDLVSPVGYTPSAEEYSAFLKAGIARFQATAPQKINEGPVAL